MSGLPGADRPLLMVVRQSDAIPGTVPGRSWSLPCAFCGETCWVDPEALFGTRCYEILQGAPLCFQRVADAPMAKTVCCLRCIGRSGETRTDLRAEDRAALHRIGEAYARLVERLRSGGTTS